MNTEPRLTRPPENELELQNRLTHLFKEWMAALLQHENFAGLKEDNFVPDGFFPNYTKQKTRILFIGRELRDLSNLDYISVLQKAYRVDGKIARQSLNANCYHSRLLYIAYAIMNGMPRWQDIPWATEIGKTIGDDNGISYALINVSKISNDAVNFKADWPTIRKAVQTSTAKRNFLREEIDILTPNLVITMNLGDVVELLGKVSPLESEEKAQAYTLDYGKGPILLIDTFHFAAFTKGDIEDFYLPICRTIKRHSSLLRLN